MKAGNRVKLTAANGATIIGVVEDIRGEGEGYSVAVIIDGHTFILSDDKNKALMISESENVEYTIEVMQLLPDIATVSEETLSDDSLVYNVIIRKDGARLELNVINEYAAVEIAEAINKNCV